jgi:hypothetical protein
MVSAASGTRAESLARLHPAPRRRPAPPATCHPEIADLRTRATDAVQSAYLGSLVGDEETIAAYCVRFSPADPRDWTRRFRRIHAAARLEVWRHRIEIIQIATELYHEGHVEFLGAADDNDFFSGGMLPTE